MAPTIAKVIPIIFLDLCLYLYRNLLITIPPDMIPLFYLILRILFSYKKT
jgi:hypothetical protein